MRVAASGSPSEPVEKLMSLAPHEFASGCQRLASGDDRVDESEAKLAVGDGHVVISYDALEGVRLGGLLELPRANVRLSFDGVDGEAREAFLRKFEITFQRGGG